MADACHQLNEPIEPAVAATADVLIESDRLRHALAAITNLNARHVAATAAACPVAAC